jgi:outer membrane lipoprotein SlyB
VFAIVVSVDRVILFKAEEMDAVPSQKPAIELLLDLDSGKTISIIQKEGDHSFNKGQRVKVLKSKGKSRVMPLK